MALTYDQQGALQTNLPFGLRVQVAVVGFANYIENEGPSVPQHNARLRFAVGAHGARGQPPQKTDRHPGRRITCDLCHARRGMRFTERFWTCDFCANAYFRRLPKAGGARNCGRLRGWMEWS